MSGGGGKVCESCKSGKAILYCRVDSAFLCMGCDNRIHGAGRNGNGHERVWMCDVCEQAPGSVNCKADAAVLCVSCDHDIHSANPLALRHERYPVSPFHDSSAPSVKTTNDFNLIFSNDDDYCNNDILVNSISSQAAAVPVVEVNYSHTEKDDHQVEAAALPWMMPTLLNPHPKKFVEDEPTFDVAKSIGGDYFLSDADPYNLDLDYVPSMEINFHNSHQGHQKSSRTSAVSDGVVPEQKNSTVPPSLPPPSQLSSSSSLSTSGGHGHGHGQYYIDFSGGGSNSKPLTTTQSYYSSTTPKSLAKTVSSSSLDAGVVPDGSSSEGGGSVVATQLCALDREARVLRYREKRKKRKFEKTIRYASRKAYAETRPRVKGRFVKRTDNTETEEAASVVAIDQNQMYPYTPSSMLAFMSDAAGFGVVPTF